MQELLIQLAAEPTGEVVATGAANGSSWSHTVAAAQVAAVQSAESSIYFRSQNGIEMCIQNVQRVSVSSVPLCLGVRKPNPQGIPLCGAAVKVSETRRHREHGEEEHRRNEIDGRCLPQATRSPRIVCDHSPDLRTAASGWPLCSRYGRTVTMAAT